MTRILMIATLALTMTAGAAQAHCGSCGVDSTTKTSSHSHDHPQADIVETAIGAGSFKTLVAAVQAAGLVETLKGEGPFTVFAPTDEAFAKLPAGTVEALLADKSALTEVLTYHVVSGAVDAAEVSQLQWASTIQGQSLRVQSQNGTVMIDDATVVKADVEASNGVIHVIDTVMLPREDILETARDAGSFNTLATAIEAAGLEETLSGEGPFTVFAPTDAAFAQLPKGTIESLLDNTPQLANILTYHVVAGRVLAGDLVAGGARTFEVESVQGAKLTVSLGEDGTVMIDDAVVTKTDIIAGNGVIHVIDAVVLPKSSS